MGKNTLASTLLFTGRSARCVFINLVQMGSADEQGGHARTLEQATHIRWGAQLPTSGFRISGSRGSQAARPQAASNAA